MSPSKSSLSQIGLFAALVLFASVPLAGQTVISGGGNYISGTTFYLGTHSGSPSGFSLVYDDAGSDAVKFHSNRIASWLWENPDGGSGSYPSMRLDQSNNLILYNGTNEGVKLNPVGKSLTLGGASGAILTANGTGLSTNGAFTVAGGFTNTNGSLTGGATGLSLSAGGTDQSIDLTPSGTGTIRIRNGVTPSLYSTLSTTASGSFALNAASGNLALQTSGSNKLYILSSNGNVGIGIINPSRKLEVVDDPGVTSGEKFIANFVRTSTSNGVFLGYRANGTAVTAALVRAGNSLPLTLGTTTTPEAFTILNSGNVGIGTTNPVAKLEVIGGANPFGLIVEGDGVSANARIALRRANATSVSATGNIDWIGNDNLVGARIGVNDTIAGAMEFKLGGSGVGNTKAIITSAGNVGVGTSSPYSAANFTTLDIRGTTGGDLSLGSTSTRTGILYSSTGSTVLGSVNAAPLVLNTADVERLRIDSAGNVGIGTMAPQQLLHVSGASPQFLLRSTGTGLRGLWTKVDDSIGAIVFDSSFNNTGAYPMSFRIADFESLRIAVNGNVGIGTTSPTRKLVVEGAGEQAIELSSTGTGAHRYGLVVNPAWASGSFHLYDFTGDNSRVTISPTGNVGIGTTSPIAPLDVRAASATTVYAATGGAGAWGADFHNLDGGGDRYVKLAGGSHAAVFMNGNVGIGTTNPAYKLEVSGDGIFSKDAATQLTVQNSSGSSTRTSGVNFRIDTVNLWQLLTDNAASNTFFLQYNGLSANRFFAVNSAGNVGIGTTTPATQLHIAGNSAAVLGTGINTQNVLTTGTTGFIGYSLRRSDDVNGGWLMGTSGAVVGDFAIYQNQGSNTPVSRFHVLPSGNVGIGTTNPTQKLSVAGTIRAYEIIVDSGWADYVFEDGYRLAPLAEVESHIKAKKHLPGIPSAAEVAEHGVSMGDMQAKLLSKVEELTLHLIAQEKELAALRSEVAQLKASSKP